MHARVKATTGGIYYGPDDSEHLGFTLGAGYEWRGFNARLGFHFYDLGSPSEWSTFAASVGYTFWFR